jgi:hypothetical protein
VVMWCIIDSCNHEVSKEFFMMQTFQFGLPHYGHMSPKHLESPLTLAFIQFAFMGVLFLGVWLACANTPCADLSELKDNIFDNRWSGMALTHVFSTFWLQSMMMPTQVMSLGFFAASRSIEVPATAVLRSTVIGGNVRIQSVATSALMFAAACSLFFSYSQIAECLCIWSGHGVELSGVALYFVYGLVLVLPATNVVCQEAVMVKFGTHPLLILGVQNILGCMICIPCLILAQSMGWEDVGLAVEMMTGRTDMTMLVIWLCVQMALLSVVGIGMIVRTDSFWAVAFRSFRVVFWWCKELFLFYFMSKVSLSVARPNASIWSVMMLCGISVALAAMLKDHKESVQRGTGKSDASGAVLTGLQGSAYKAV